MPTLGERTTNAIELGGGTRGIKTILGAALIVLSHQLLALQDLIPVFPDNDSLEKLANNVELLIEWVEWALNIAGNGLLGVGFIDKILKFFKIR